MSVLRRTLGVLFILAGLAAVLGAIGLTVYNIYDEQRATECSQAALTQIMELTGERRFYRPEAVISDESVIPDYVLNPEEEMPAVEVLDNKYVAILEIPALSLALPVLKEWSYSGLKMAPCRYSGNLYKNDLVICAHNYRSHFGTLDTLTGGEDVIVTDTDGNCFAFTVDQVEILQPTEISRMIDSAWDLTLFTCNYNGNARVAVRCRAVEQ